ncbi:Membrane bound O-acyl transferase family protein [Aspergillus niger]|uniref:Membrane bound O-acyl transferase family protein n=1 Tax=Aspergillus niger TaxID=5061 RepID=A0A505I406_ASPNG|nr:Membrane bound O-acyl transferase family protein [Aspergillus niger]
MTLDPWGIFEIPASLALLEPPSHPSADLPHEHLSEATLSSD